MFEAINNASIALYFKGVAAVNACKAKIKSFFSDERGLSGIVVAVLLILIAVLLIAVFWEALSGWLKGVWDKIIKKGDLSEPGRWNQNPPAGGDGPV